METKGKVDVHLGCNYQGYEFGGGYLDSVCIDGYLWDADSGDADPSGDGWLYTCGGDIPCPMCNQDECIDYYAESNAFFLNDDEDESDEEAHNAKARAAAISLVTDIRRNRGIDTSAVRSSQGGREGDEGEGRG